MGTKSKLSIFSLLVKTIHNMCYHCYAHHYTTTTTSHNYPNDFGVSSLLLRMPLVNTRSKLFIRTQISKNDAISRGVY